MTAGQGEDPPLPLLVQYIETNCAFFALQLLKPGRERREHYF